MRIKLSAITKEDLKGTYLEEMYSETPEVGGDWEGISSELSTLAGEAGDVLRSLGIFFEGKTQIGESTILTHSYTHIDLIDYIEPGESEFSHWVSKIEPLFKIINEAGEILDKVTQHPLHDPKARRETEIQRFKKNKEAYDYYTRFLKPFGDDTAFDYHQGYTIEILEVIQNHLNRINPKNQPQGG